MLCAEVFAPVNKIYTDARNYEEHRMRMACQKVLESLKNYYRERSFEINRIQIKSVFGQIYLICFDLCYYKLIETS